MKRVLIITYYWPPSAGSGVQRWLKFSKYLPKNGWQPVIYTPENPDFFTQDSTLLKDIPPEVELIKTKIWEPYGVYKRLNKGKVNKNINNGLLDLEGGKSSLKKYISYVSKWIRGNVFIPDPKIFWVKKSVKFLSNYLEENPVDTIVSTGPPHSMHLIALELKKKTGLPWISDFRDPWSKLDLLDDYNISTNSRKKYKLLEKSVLQNADLCLTVSQNWAKMFYELGAKKVEVITNGFDSEDVELKADKSNNEQKFIISHFGLLNHLRNPTYFWKALDKACEENRQLADLLEVHIGGTIDRIVLRQLKKLKLVEKKLTVHEYIPHNEVIDWYKKSSLLLLLTFNSEIGQGNIPGKMFEYLAMKKPIISFGHSNGDVARIFNEVGCGNNFEYTQNDLEPIKNAIISAFERRNKSSSFGSIEKYNRKNLTKRLVTLMDNISSN